MNIKKENRKIKILKEKLFFAGLMGIATAIVWVSLSVYTSFVKTSIDPKIQELIKPFNPNLDGKLLEEYELSRVQPPETFTVVAITNKETMELATVDPFTEKTNTASPSSDSL